MQKPIQMPGCCPHYDGPSGCCYLDERFVDSGARDCYCRSSNYHACGSYESWSNGNNYKDKW